MELRGYLVAALGLGGRDAEPGGPQVPGLGAGWLHNE